MTRRLRVDWPACAGRGLCHELLPEAVQLDEWGYPILGELLDDELLPAARAAVRACPTLALRLVHEPRDAPDRSALPSAARPRSVIGRKERS